MKTQLTESERRDLLAEVDRLYGAIRSLRYLTEKDSQVIVPKSLETAAKALLRQVVSKDIARNVWATACEQDNLAPSKVMEDMEDRAFDQYLVRSPLPAVVIARNRGIDWSTVSQRRRAAIENHEACQASRRQVAAWAEYDADEDIWVK